MYKNLVYVIFGICMVVPKSIFTCQQKTPRLYNDRITQLLYSYATNNIQKIDKNSAEIVMNDMVSTNEKKNKEKQLQIKTAFIHALATQSQLAQEYLTSAYALHLYSEALVTNNQHLVQLFKKHTITFASLTTQDQLYVITQACFYQNYQLLNTLRMDKIFAKKIISMPLDIQDYLNRIFARTSEFFD